MKYLGSKNRISKHISPIILKDRKPGQWYVEPFAGGMNMIDKVDGNRLAADIHPYLIAMWKALIYTNFSPPPHVGEEMYKFIKDNQDLFPPELVGYVGFNSFLARWFAGYRKDKCGRQEYWGEHYRNILKQVPKLRGVQFECCSYLDLDIPDKSLIYCDPPYEGTTGYKINVTGVTVGFNHSWFWEKCRQWTKEGHQVFISELSAPDDFDCIWELKVPDKTTRGTERKKKLVAEKLFILQGVNNA